MMMAAELLERSPMRTLTASIRGGLLPGQLGVIMAPPGVGKSALLVHIALGHLLRGTELLHVSLQDHPSQVRSFYDEILTELSVEAGFGVMQPGDEVPVARPTTALVDVERNRVIHSFLGSFTVERLQGLLRTLDEVMHFRPNAIVIDGQVSATEADVAGWRDVVRESGVRLWVALRTEVGEDLSAISGRFDTAVLLEPAGRDVGLKVLRAGGQPADDGPDLRLDPVSMLVLSEQSEDDHFQLPPSPSPQASTLYSGGATGTECAFGEEAEKWGLREVNFTFEGHRQLRERGSRPLDAADLKKGAVSMAYVRSRIHRGWDEDQIIKGVLQCQWHMVSRAKQVFVVGVIQEDLTVRGGTGWAVELARRWNKPVWVFCQERKGWYSWTEDAWELGEPVIESTRVAATGTRFLSDAGRAAIASLFERSFRS